VDVAAIKALAGCPVESVNQAELPDEDNKLVLQYVEVFTALLVGFG